MKTSENWKLSHVFRDSRGLYNIFLGIFLHDVNKFGHQTCPHDLLKYIEWKEV